jgi:two-component system OmpR family response regulator
MSNDQLQRILYVEDEDDIRAVAELALVNVAGFELRTCASGEEALAVAETFSPDLLLLDVMMPDMDGPATLRALREIPALADTPAIFMTAKVQPDEVNRYLELGAVDVIAKPFDPMSLGEQLRNAWRRIG